MIRRKRPKPTSWRAPDETTKMSGPACDIAVSEMIGVPVGQICGYAIAVRSHEVTGHALRIMPGPGSFEDARDLFAAAVANIDSHHPDTARAMIRDLGWKLLAVAVLAATLAPIWLAAGVTR